MFEENKESINQSILTCKLKDCTLINGYKQLDADQLEKLNENFKDEIDEKLDVKLLPSSKNYYWGAKYENVKDYVCEGECFVMGIARYANTKYVNGKFISANNIIIQSNDTNKLLTKYLYYFVVNKEKEIYKKFGGVYPKFQRNIFNELIIKIPDIETQLKIVKTLDKFKELQQELQQELQLRNKQYKYYMNNILSEDGLNNVVGGGYKQYKLNECAIIDNGKEVKTKELFPLYGANGIYDYVNYYNYDGEYLLIGRNGATHNEDGTPILNLINGKFAAGSRSRNLKESNICKLKYVYYYLQTLNIKELVQGGRKIKHSDVDNLIISFPKSLDEQQYIVDILDKMSDYCNNINDGLEKELNLSEKQYKYYLNKLLTF